MILGRSNSMMKIGVQNVTRSYLMRSQDITYSNGIKFKVIGTIVPKSLCEELKHLPHVGHLSIVNI